MNDITIPSPPRLPKVTIPVADRQEIIDYFTILDTQLPDNSTEWCHVHNILSSLLHEDDPIEGIQQIARQQPHPLYQTALEMLHAVRHRLEAGSKEELTELQKKVLTHLLKGLRAEVQHTSCTEEAVSGLSDQERIDLTEALYKMWGEIEDWDGTASDEFSLSSLCRLALTWVGGA